MNNHRRSRLNFTLDSFKKLNVKNDETKQPRCDLIGKGQYGGLGWNDITWHGKNELW